MSMNRAVFLAFCTLLAVSFVAALSAPLACAQGRVSDKDVETMMKNLRDDVRSFRPVFDSAIKRSTIRKTSKEKDARESAARLEQQTNAMLSYFRHTKKGGDEVSGAVSTAHEIDGLVNSLQLGPKVSFRWEKIQTELRQVTSALQM
jgi:hypothetical protein